MLCAEVSKLKLGLLAGKVLPLRQVANAPANATERAEIPLGNCKNPKIRRDSRSPETRKPPSFLGSFR